MGDPSLGECSVAGCGRHAAVKGWCSRHYLNDRQRRRAAALAELKAEEPICAIEWCDQHVDRRGVGIFCVDHLLAHAREQGLRPPKRERKPRDPEAPPTYRVVNHRGRFMGEHRKVMEEHLGRPLADHENVHHINGVRDDNRLENLELWSTSQPSGQRIEDKVAWAEEILRQYKPS